MKRPVEILVQQAREDSESESYLPKRLAKLGLSAVIAAKFAAYPFFSQILTSLLSNFSSRAEARLLTIAEELEAQQARIADLLEDKTFYESEEFQTLFALVLERIHSTHEQEKLRQFGDALANSALPGNGYQEKEAFIRILRDLSIHDLKTLGDNRLRGWLPIVHKIEYSPEVLSSLSRLNGMGLVIEQFHRPPGGNAGSENLDTQIALREVLTAPVRRAFHLSPFGERFLDFVKGARTQRGQQCQTMISHLPVRVAEIREHSSLRKFEERFLRGTRTNARDVAQMGRPYRWTSPSCGRP